MTQVQVLTVKHVKASARRAYKARKLTAQHRNPSKRACLLQVGSCHCAIGSALTKATLKKVHEARKNGSGPEALKDAGIITFDNRISEGLNLILTAHDNWAGVSRDLAGTSDAAKAARLIFLKTIAA